MAAGGAQRAVAVPPSGSPAQLLQLQRQHGNQAVQRIVQGHAASGDVQRKLSFAFTGNVGAAANLKGRLRSTVGLKDDHNTAYRHIMDAYRRYEAATDLTVELAHLHTMMALTKFYVDNYGDKNYTKTFSAKDLRARCEKELETVPYRIRFADFASGLKGNRSAVDDVIMFSHSDLIELRDGDKAAFEEKLKVKTAFFGKEVVSRVLLYAEVLTPEERAAVTRYTDAQFQLINPALAGNTGWLTAMVDKLHEESKASGAGGLPPEVVSDLDQTMADNRAIGAMAAQALTKLPSWTDGPVFRGETFPAAEGKHLRKEGGTKRWPHLVSTSKNEGVSRGFAQQPTDARPVGVLFKFVKHLNGKDIHGLSSVASESEVLFVPNTAVQVKKLVKKQDLGKGKQFVEIEVEELGGAPARPKTAARRKSGGGKG